MDDLYKEVGEDVYNRYKAGTSYSSKDFEGMTDEEHGYVLHHSAELQREHPENAMRAIQRKLGGGLYPHVVEHVGDIYHRAQERGGAYGLSYVLPKVRDMVHTLNDPLFEVWAKRSVRENSEFDKDPSINWDAAVVLGKDYAKEHSRLPIYNHPALLANQAAQHLGNMNFGAASATMGQLYAYMKGPERGLFDVSKPSPEEEAEWSKINDNWRRLHSRQASIDFLKERGL